MSPTLPHLPRYPWIHGIRRFMVAAWHSAAVHMPESLLGVPRPFPHEGGEHLVIPGVFT